LDSRCTSSRTPDRPKRVILFYVIPQAWDVELLQSFSPLNMVSIFVPVLNKNLREKWCVSIMNHIKLYKYEFGFVVEWKLSAGFVIALQCDALDKLLFMMKLYEL
jgi:hypothetical protein